MTNPELARGWTRQAENILQEARAAADNGLWHLAVRRCQESVEMALKGLLGLVGIEVPKIHDVGFILRQYKDRFPKAIQAEIDRIQSISRRLKKERETSFYGDEELMLPPDQIYNKEDATQSLAEAEFVVKLALSNIPAAKA